jgi:hypothetical protein
MLHWIGILWQQINFLNLNKSLCKAKKVFVYKVIYQFNLCFLYNAIFELHLLYKYNFYLFESQKFSILYNKC